MLFRSAKAVEKLYREGMYQQGGGSKVVRTADLPNPFTSSIRTTPAQVKLTAVSNSQPAPEAVSASVPETDDENTTQTIAPRARW